MNQEIYRHLLQERWSARVSRCSLRHSLARRCAGFFATMRHAPKMNWMKPVDHGTEVLDSAIERGQEFVEKGKESLRETGRQAKEFAEAGRKAAQ